MKLWVEGRPEQVRPFVQELARHAEILPRQPVKKVNEDQEVVACLVRYRPRKRVTVVELHTQGGGVVRIPFLDLVVAEVMEGQKVFSGRVYEIFG